jgi:hypothetical protein
MVQFDEIFEISILGLANDIVSSVYKTQGYMEMLQKDNNIQDHFENTIENIHAKLDVRPLPDGTENRKLLCILKYEPSKRNKAALTLF